MAGELDSHPPLSPERLLIEAAQRDAARLEAAATGRTESISVAASSIDAMRDSFPGYKITREIHRGGQGVVYQAIHKGTKRKVAIKVMRDGPFASARERTRFDREMQILGQLNDPHIVQIHDASSVGGCQYYVMDYISGHALDLYMSSRRWTIDETLRLFLKICEAVNAAHVRGVIHRDLKPGNIRIDQEGEPHILDFGLAKVAVGETSNDSQAQLMSITGEFIGSLPWASPEQAEGIPGKIDIRTDVYSLGVVLFQMLTGTFPYLVVGPMRTVMDNILSADPVKPRSVRREIDDEVETIVLKCLNKDRDRRYQTAGELSRDVGRYLAGEPIEAKRDSTAYLLKKALVRYRLQAGVAAAFLFLILMAGAAQVRSGRNAAFERDRARAEEQRAVLALGLFNDMIEQANPEKGRVPNPSLRDALEWAADNVGKRVQTAPEDEATLRNVIGKAFSDLGKYDKAKTQFVAARESANKFLPQQTPNLVKSLLGLSTYHTQHQKDFSKAKAYGEEALNAALLFYGEIHAEVAHCLHSLGVVYCENGDYEQGELLLHQALEMRRELLGNRHRDTAQSLNALACSLRDRESFAEAESFFDQALSIYRVISGEPSYDVARVLGSLGQCMRGQKKYEPAEQLLQEALEMKGKVHSSDSSVANTHHQLALLYFEREPRYLERAEKHCREAWELRTKKELLEAKDSKKLLDSILQARQLAGASDPLPLKTESGSAEPLNTKE